MATKNILLVLGQSNAGTVADAPTWEEQNTDIALRYPVHVPSTITQFSMGSDRDRITMPDTFPGGPQTAQRGAGTNAGSWQTFSVRGSGINAIRYLTPYNPSSSYASNGIGHTTTYPGVGAISTAATDGSVIDGSEITTTTRWQPQCNSTSITTTASATITLSSDLGLEVNDRVEFVGASLSVLLQNTTYYVTARTTSGPFTCTVSLTVGGSSVAPSGSSGSATMSTVDLGTITRRRTGTTHTAWMTHQAKNKLRISPPMADPVPENGELFDYPIVCGKDYTSGVMLLSTSFGGFSDVGSAGDGNVTSGKRHGVFQGSRSGSAGLITCPGRPPTVGHPVKFTLTGLGTLAVASPVLSESTTYYIQSVRDPDVEGSGFGTITAWSGAGDMVITIANHGMVKHERLQFSGVLPSNLSAGTTYYVHTVASINTIKISTDFSGGSAITSASGGGAATATRLDASCQFTISDEPGGTPIVFSADSSTNDGTDNVEVSFLTQWRGSLTGMQLRSTSGANDGAKVLLSDVTLNSDDITSEHELASTFSTTPSRGDTFVIEPQDHQGSTVPFEKWAYFLPWSQFEGDYQWQTTRQVTIASAAGSNVAVTETAGITVAVNDQVRFFCGDPDGKVDGLLPAALVNGRRYFVHSIAGNVYYLKNNITDTSAVQGSSTAGVNTDGYVAVNLYQEGRRNTAPPGFNYPNHYSTPSLYQAYSGTPLLTPKPRMAFHPGLAVRINEDLGETLYVAALAVSGSSLSHRSVMPASYRALYGFGWYDPRQLLSWPDGSEVSCFERLEETLDACVTALSKEGHTGNVIGVAWAQGEADSHDEEYANRYYVNATRFKKGVRDLIKAKNLASGPADNIPWVQPYIAQTADAHGVYASTVNAAITSLVSDDPYMATCKVSDLTFMGDSVHYDGESMSILGDRIFDAWKSLQRTGTSDLDVCNQALANIGIGKTLTSIYPSDGSYEADLCARYYENARDDLLDRHNWDFATRRTDAMESVTDGGNDQWTYAFRLPVNAIGVIALLTKNATDDVMTGAVKNQVNYTTELDATNRLVVRTDEKTPVCRYKVRVVDSTKFSAQFTTALSWSLAARLAGPLVKGDEGIKIIQLAEQTCEYYLQRAAQHDARQFHSEQNITVRNKNPWGRV